MAIPQARELTEEEKAQGFTSIVLVTPGKKSKSGAPREYYVVDPNTGEAGGAISRIEFERMQYGQRKFQGQKFIFVEPQGELEQRLRARERRIDENTYSKEMAQKEAEYEARRIAEGKIKAKDVVLTQPGAGKILEGLLSQRAKEAQEKAKREAEERAKFPTREERIRDTLRKQRILSTLELQAQKAREDLLEIKPVQKKTEIEGPEIFLDPETSRKVRKQLSEKEIQQTKEVTELPDFRSYFPPKKRFSEIGIAQPFPPGLVTTETGLIKVLQTEKRKQAKSKFEEFEISLETTSKIGLSFEKEGKALAGAGFIFVGRTAETAFGVSPPGIFRSIQKKGVTETLEQFTGIPLIQAIKEGELLQATTPTGRLAEAGGITTGAIIGSRITTGAFKAGGKTIRFFQKESARLRTPEFSEIMEESFISQKVKGGEPTGTGQQRFVKLTESGTEIPQFKQSIPEVTRVIVNKKTGKIIGVFDPISGKVIKSRINDIQLDLPERFGIEPKKNIIRQEIDLTGNRPIITTRNIIEPTKPQQQPLTKQTKLGKFGEGFLDRELFDIEFQVPTARPSRLRALLRSKKGGVILEKPILEKEIQSPIETEFITGRTEPRLKDLILLPPGTRIEEEFKFKPDIDFGRDLERERKRDRGLLTLNLPKEIQAGELSKLLEQPPRLKPKEGTEFESIRTPERRRERDRERKIAIIPDISIRTEQELIQELQKPEIKKPEESIPKESENKLFLNLQEEKKIPGVPREKDLFFAEVKEKGKFIRANKKPLPINKALNLGAEAVDNTPSATFKLVKAKNKGKDIVDDLYFNLSGKFTKKNGSYIEKNIHRIDSQGEIEGITVKGWLSQRRKGLRI